MVTPERAPSSTQHQPKTDPGSTPPPHTQGSQDDPKSTPSRPHGGATTMIPPESTPEAALIRASTPRRRASPWRSGARDVYAGADPLGRPELEREGTRGPGRRIAAMRRCSKCGAPTKRFASSTAPGDFECARSAPARSKVSAQHHAPEVHTMRWPTTGGADRAEGGDEPSGCMSTQAAAPARQLYIAPRQTSAKKVAHRRRCSVIYRPTLVRLHSVCVKRSLCWRGPGQTSSGRRISTSVAYGGASRGPVWL